MTILLQDGFDYASRAQLSDRGWSGSPFNFFTGAISHSGYPSFAIDVINNNDVSHELPFFNEGVVGFANKNGSQPPLFPGGTICYLTQTVHYTNCVYDAATTVMTTGIGLDDVNRLYCWQTYPVFSACAGPACRWTHTGNTTSVLGYASYPFPMNVWNYIELKLTSGIEVHINGADDIAVVALPGPAALAGYCGVSVDGYERITFSAPGLGAGQGVDDVYVCVLGGPSNNDFLGNVHIDTLVPDADGAYTEWNPMHGGVHYVEVDDLVADGDASQNSTRDAGARDSFSMLPIPSNTNVLNTQVNLTARSNNSDTRRCQPLVRQAGVDYYGPMFTLARDWQMFSWLLNQDPTDADWTPATVDADEFGIRAVDGGGTHDPLDIRLSLVGEAGVG